MGLSPFLDSFGVGAAARDPSPRKMVESSHLVNCAASRMVNGRTRTVTEIDDAPSEMAMVRLLIQFAVRGEMRRLRSVMLEESYERRQQ